jgi:hypothetical protein
MVGVHDNLDVVRYEVVQAVVHRTTNERGAQT